MNFQSWGRTFIISLSVLFFISLNTNAQNFNCIVEGNVIAQSTGKPLENVNIYISGTTFGTTTDKSGYFRFKTLLSGTLNIIASMVGYKPEHIGFNLNFNDYLRIEYHSEYESVTKISWIKLQHPDAILDKFGYPLDPFAFNIYGYWSHKGIANMLPKYYYP